MINKLSIIGVGLIGGSLALALKRSGYCKKIVGIGRDQQRLQAACEQGVIDQGTTDYQQGVLDADVVLITVPLNAYVSVFTSIKPFISDQAIITDAGSAKACVVEDAVQVFGSVPKCLVPGHPIAGHEKSGFEAANPDLFNKRRVILTPLPDTDQQAIKAVTEMWQAAGACIEVVAIDTHDRLLAATSHLPHMLAFGLVDSLAQQSNANEIFRFAAGGFRDFTRIAASDPVMWRDICLRNNKALLESLALYENDLAQIRVAIEKQDGAELEKIFTRAKKARDQFDY